MFSLRGVLGDSARGIWAGGFSLGLEGHGSVTSEPRHLWFCYGLVKWCEIPGSLLCPRIPFSPKPLRPGSEGQIQRRPCSRHLSCGGSRKDVWLQGSNKVWNGESQKPVYGNHVQILWPIKLVLLVFSWKLVTVQKYLQDIANIYDLKDNFQY